MVPRFARDARLYVVARVFDGLLGAATQVGKLHPNAKPHLHSVERISNIRYVDGTKTADHLLDVWRPTDAPSALRASTRHEGPPWPVVLYVHGGGFSTLSKDSHWMMALAFARRGFCVFNISYRLAPRHRFPSAIEDVCRAFVWVTKNAARFGGDTNRMVLSGESAGANLVTSLTIATSYERPEPFARAAWETEITPRAVVPACGLFQVSDHGRFRRAKPHIPWWVAGRLQETEESYLGDGPWPCSLDLADPLVFLERGLTPARPLPPFFMSVGTRDPLLPDTRRLGTALRALGTEAVERYYAGEGHAFQTAAHKTTAKECWAETFTFLGRHVPFAAREDDGTRTLVS
jgi:acetyl esterase